MLNEFAGIKKISDESLGRDETPRPYQTQYCIFFVGTQFWEAGKTLKFLAEQQYFKKDKTSTENPVKVWKSLY